VPAQTIGRYEVLRVLGSGGFATVWLARDPDLVADVALKVLADNWARDPDMTERFLEEARLLRRCDDDRVVRVHTIERLEDGRPYFVMDYAEGGTLADRIVARMDAGQRFGVREAVELSLQLAGCLTAVHAAGIVHRDVKPSNVLFRSGRMILGDLGLARRAVAPSAPTITGGTPAYAAPEQLDPARAATVDARADLYAAAAVLYELLAGVPPPAGAAPAVAQARRDVPPGLAEVVRHGLAPSAADRFASAGDWSAALSAAARELPPDAALPPAAASAPPPPVPPFGATVAAAVPAPPPPPAAAGAPPTALPAEPAPAGEHKSLWVLLVGILGAIAVVVAIAVVLGRGGSGSTSSATAVSTTTSAPSPAPTAAPPPTGVAAWFAAASGPECYPAPQAERLPGVAGAVTCPDGSITGIFAQVTSASTATGDLAFLDQRRRATGVRSWNGGEVVFYQAASGPAVAWDYTGEPYVGVGVGTSRTAVDSWWVTTGRVRA
jgi:hypothetical protein